MTSLELIGKQAQDASYQLAIVTPQQKAAVLCAIADALISRQQSILDANQRDLQRAEANGISAAMLDRLTLNQQRLTAMANDVRQVASLPDPIGEEWDARLLDNGLRLCKRRIPLGVVGVIYEARPNVTIDVACLCLKTGNATILRGGSETRETNTQLIALLQEILGEYSLPVASVQYIDDPDRARVSELLKLDQYVDMIIPRGGPGLQRLCLEQATIPVITGGNGICHLYVDQSADLEKALVVIENAKVQRPAACNALDTLLVHSDIAAQLLPALSDRLAEQGVGFKACPQALSLLPQADAADEGDFDTEWLGLTLGVRLVSGLEAAINHIHQHSSGHSDGILTNDLHNAECFINEINSAAVYVNASTRFTDGAQFGLGAEVAVSTQKLHARGPLGLRELTTYKWIGVGDGLIRS